MTIPEGFYTAGMNKFYKFNVILTGKENYPIIGNGSVELKKEVKRVFKLAKGLRKYWSCNEKAILIQKEIGGHVIIGSHYVWSSDFKSQYGFEYNPPYEFHAWVELSDNTIIDIALPGVIRTGLELRDEVGPYLTGRKPVIFVGSEVPNFLVYDGKECHY